MKQNDNWKKEFEELIDLYIAPNRRGTVKQCVLGDAEYKGTVRINASAIPLFRNVFTFISSQKAQSYKEGYDRGFEIGKEVTERYEAEMKAINLEIDL